MNPNLNLRQFDDHENIPMEHFGVQVVSAGHEKHLRKFHRSDDWTAETREVPIGRVRAGQNTVSAAGARITGPDEPRTLPARQLPGGDVMLDDGHHYLARQRQRGAQTVSVRIGSKYGECLDTHCGYS